MNGLVPIAVAIIVLLPVPFITNEYVQYVINLMLVYGLAAAGFNIILGYLGQLAFANMAFFGIGAYAFGFATTYLQLTFVPGLIIGGLAGGVAGLIVGLPALRLKSYYLAIITLVFGELMRWLYIHADSITHGSSGLAIPDASFFGYVLDNEGKKYYAFLIVVWLAVWATRNLLRSRIGRTWVAIRENELAVASLGLSPALFKILAFGWSGFLVGLAGGLFAVLVGRIAPDSFGLDQLLLQFTFVMVGGLGSVYGSLAGTAILTAVPEFLRSVPGLEEIVFSLLVIVILRFMPGGLNGLMVRFFPRLRETLKRDG